MHISFLHHSIILIKMMQHFKNLITIIKLKFDVIQHKAKSLFMKEYYEIVRVRSWLNLHINYIKDKNLQGLLCGENTGNSSLEPQKDGNNISKFLLKGKNNIYLGIGHIMENSNVNICGNCLRELGSDRRENDSLGDYLKDRVK